MSIMPASVVADLETVAAFFGIDIDAKNLGNRRIFREAHADCREAFAATFSALASEVKTDPRYGMNQRVRESVAESRQARNRRGEL